MSALEISARPFGWVQTVGRFVGGDDELPSVNELRQHLAAFGAAATEIGESFATLTFIW